MGAGVSNLPYGLFWGQGSLTEPSASVSLSVRAAQPPTVGALHPAGFITLGGGLAAPGGVVAEGASPECCTPPPLEPQGLPPALPASLLPSGGPGTSGVELVFRPQEALGPCSLFQCRPVPLSVRCVSFQKEP